MVTTSSPSKIAPTQEPSPVSFPNDWSPLHIAAFRNETWRLSGLAANQAVDQKDQLGRTALHIATEQGNGLVVQLLIGLGAQVNCPDGDGWTALHYAAAGGFPQIIRTLCKSRAHVSAAADGGTTPLHLATGFNHPLAVQVLREYRADANAQDIYQRRASQKVSASR